MKYFKVDKRKKIETQLKEMLDDIRGRARRLEQTGRNHHAMSLWTTSANLSKLLEVHDIIDADGKLIK